MLKKFFHYMIPSVAAMWIFSLYTMVDGMFVAWGVGPVALAGVNISMPYINFIFAFSLLFATSVSTTIAIAFGKGEKDRANKLFSMNAGFLFTLSIIITILTWIFMDRIAIFLGASQDTINYVKEYLRIISLFNFAFIVSYNFEVLVKVDGFPKLATLGVLSSAITNIVLDYLFVMVFHLGIAGAAWATGISQVVSVTLFAIHFYGRKSKLKFIKFDLNMIKEYRKILPIGIADSITEFSIGIATFLFNVTIQKYIGDSGIVSFTVITYFNTIALMTMTGITQGMQPLVSFYYGAEDKKSYMTFLRYAIYSVIVSSAVIFAVAFVGTDKVVSLFIDSHETELFNQTITALRSYSPVFLIMGFNVVASGFFAAITKAFNALVISVGRGFVFLSVIIHLFTFLWQENGIWISAFGAEVCCLILTGVLYTMYRKKTFENKIVCLEK